MSRSDDLPPSEYVLAHIREALASDDRVNALDIDVRLQGHEIILSGTVQNTERRSAVDAVVRSVVPNHLVLNELAIRSLAGEGPTEPAMAIRVAAVGDIHFGLDSAGSLRPHLSNLSDEADLLLLAGDLTRHGDPQEAAVLAEELVDLPVPVVAVLGNHDHHSDEFTAVAKVIEASGVTVLEKASSVFQVGDMMVGIAGAKGFGGGFAGVSCSDFGEAAVKDFVREAREAAVALERELRDLDTDVRIALMHYSPIEGTLRGEKPEIYPWLGSYMLAEAIDTAGCDFAFHGHAHAGTEAGTTPGGVPVRNVAQPVLGCAYKVYCIEVDRILSNVTALGGVAG